VKLLTWWKSMVDRLGAQAGQRHQERRLAFVAGKDAITLESTGSLGDFTKAGFQVGTGFYPKINASDAGGRSSAARRCGSSARQGRRTQAGVLGVREVLGEQGLAGHLAHLHRLLPVNKGALDTDVDKQWVASKPQFQTAITQLQNTKLSTATQGCLFGVMPRCARPPRTPCRPPCSRQGPQAGPHRRRRVPHPAIKDYNDSVK